MIALQNLLVIDLLAEAVEKLADVVRVPDLDQAGHLVRTGGHAVLLLKETASPEDQMRVLNEALYALMLGEEHAPTARRARQLRSVS